MVSRCYVLSDGGHRCSYSIRAKTEWNFPVPLCRDDPVCGGKVSVFGNLSNCITQ